jgi:hypothetical protein
MTTMFGNPGSTELACSSTSRRTSATCSACRKPWWWAWPTVMPRPPATPLREPAFGGRRGPCHGQHLHRAQEPHAAGDHRRPAGARHPAVRSLPVSGQATELPKPYVKWSCEPARAEDVPLAIARAYYIAMQEPRGPVLVSVPADDWDRLTEPVAAARGEHAAAGPSRRCWTQIGAALDASQRPAFVVGRGVDRGRPGTPWWRWPSATTHVSSQRRCRARGFPEDHRCSPASCPPCARRSCSCLAGHDLVVAIGAPAFTYHVEGQGPHLPAGAALAS